MFVFVRSLNFQENLGNVRVSSSDLESIMEDVP